MEHMRNTESRAFESGDAGLRNHVEPTIYSRKTQGTANSASVSKRPHQHREIEELEIESVSDEYERHRGRGRVASGADGLTGNHTKEGITTTFEAVDEEGEQSNFSSEGEDSEGGALVPIGYEFDTSPHTGLRDETELPLHDGILGEGLTMEAQMRGREGETLTHFPAAMRKDEGDLPSLQPRKGKSKGRPRPRIVRCEVQTVDTIDGPLEALPEATKGQLRSEQTKAAHTSQISQPGPHPTRPPYEASIEQRISRSKPPAAFLRTLEVVDSDILIPEPTVTDPDSDDA